MVIFYTVRLYYDFRFWHVTSTDLIDLYGLCFTIYRLIDLYNDKITDRLLIKRLNTIYWYVVCWNVLKASNDGHFRGVIFDYEGSFGKCSIMDWLTGGKTSVPLLAIAQIQRDKHTAHNNGYNQCGATLFANVTAFC